MYLDWIEPAPAGHKYRHNLEIRQKNWKFDATFEKFRNGSDCFSCSVLQRETVSPSSRAGGLIKSVT